MWRAATLCLIYCLGWIYWLATGTAALAEDPTAAARALGQAGNATAAAVARDSSNAADVPGYAGTSLPERNIGASRLQDEARARLADPDDPGGVAGRAVTDGATLRSAASVTATDPEVVPLGAHRRHPAGRGAPGGRAGLGQRPGLYRGPAGRTDGWDLRLRPVLRGRRLRDRGDGRGRRLRRGHDEAQHGDGTRRGRVRPRQSPFLQRPAPRLLHPPGRPRRLL